VNRLTRAWPLMALAVVLVACGPSAPRRPTTGTFDVTGRFVSAADVGGVQGLVLLSPKVGWVWARGALWRTVDGGRSWRRIRLPARGELFAGGYFSRDRAVVALGGGSTAGSAVLYATADGGRRWAVRGRVPMGATAEFRSPTDGWAVAVGTGAAGSEAFAVWVTHDGGRTWRIVRSEPMGGGGSGDVGWVRFTTPTSGWLALVRMASPGFDLARTTDGGRTWRSVRLPVGRSPSTQVLLQPPSFWGETGVMSAWQDGRLVTFHTTSGGATWSAIPAQGIAPQSPNVFPGDTVVHWLTARLGWVGPLATRAGAPGLIERTADGGRTWETVARVRGLTWGMATSLDVVTPRVAWLLVLRSADAGYEIWRTRDGGRSWTMAPRLP
jgi:photosystem II stability/assembly factor-like uncharacterized protein